MTNLNFQLGSLTISPLFLGLISSVLPASFSFWRRLKDDFREEEIFSLSLKLLLFSLLFSRLFFIASNFEQFGFSLKNWLMLNAETNFSLAGAYAGTIITVFSGTLRMKKNFWEVFDSLALPVIIFFIIGGLGYFLKYQDLWSLKYLLIGAVTGAGYPWLKKGYRSFAWYKSGKTGFIFFSNTLVIFLIALVLAFIKEGGLYLESILAVALIMASGWAIYYRSERSLKEDLSFFRKRGKKI